MKAESNVVKYWWFQVRNQPRHEGDSHFHSKNEGEIGVGFFR